ncbi:hypothetical protein FHW69_002714 [Luteibacter sp. Sphag1AF]|uniref:hypothetical protein n=1 Tax=Luteibacter sp. Sphag1AF TaxID=2587031 RepID=UPI001612E5F7|nr:hypothetical protein [Luteibacter sp. Sphag1AF]MBB3228079.1 hypothetical protein [Luteibacter sp. Sphag1AF]
MKKTGKPSSLKLVIKGIKLQRMANLAETGLAPGVSKELVRKRVDWAKRMTAAAKKTAMAARAIRVKADKTLTSKAGAKQSFVGTGLDEHVPTRMLRDPTHWGGITKSEAEDVFSSRSRTADLAWVNAHGSSEPVGGHTPAIKSKLVGGTLGAITTEHGTRDTTREKAVETTLKDHASPSRFKDVAIMGSLATIKHMVSPSTEFHTVKGDVAALSTPRHSALTGNADLRQAPHFDNFVDHIQEGRERLKWETGAQMMSDSRLQHLVPPTMKAVLQHTGNEPLQAMDVFRTHQGNLPSGHTVNTHTRTDTEDLTTRSLHDMASTTVTTGTRRRALSDARMLPPVKPTNARG